MQNNYIAVIKTRINEVQISGFGGTGAYEFLAELITMDGQSLGERKIISMGRPSNIGFFVPEKKCLLLLSRKDEEFYFEKALNEL
jgi:hypothetical protein